MSDSFIGPFSIALAFVALAAIAGAGGLIALAMQRADDAHRMSNRAQRRQRR